MASVALLTDQTTDVDGTGAAIAGECTVWLKGVFDGATVVIQGSDADANYGKLDTISPRSQATHRGRGNFNVNAKGAYYLRAVLKDAGPLTSITVNAVN